MGFRESLEFYLNLSRKELQGLCKKHNLPANRSQIQLAKSLASVVKKKSFNAASSKGTSSSPVNPAEASFNASYLPSKPKETLSPPEEMTRDVVEAFARRTISSEPDSYKLASSIKERVVDDMPHSQTGNQLEIDSHTDSRSLKKAYDADAEVVCPYPVNSGATVGFGYSTSELGAVGTRPLVAADIKENTQVLQLGLEYHGIITGNATRKSSPPRISNHKVPNPATAKNQPSSFVRVPCRQERIVECSIESGFASSEEISTKPVPSFQFFVSSEEGINLYVDLNSSPSEWINSLNNEASIHQRAQHHKSGTTSNHIKDCADVDEHMKNSSSRIGVDLQNDGVERILP